MCLGLNGGGLALAVEAGTPVDAWRKGLLGVSALQVILAILHMVSGNIWDGILDFVAAWIGYYGCRETQRIRPTMILCYVMFAILDCFWAFLNSLLLLSKVKDLSGPKWQRSMYQGVTYASFFFYAIAIFVSHKLYKMLQAQWTQTVEGGGAAPYGGAGQGGIRAPGNVSVPPTSRLLVRSPFHSSPHFNLIMPFSAPPSPLSPLVILPWSPRAHRLVSQVEAKARRRSRHQCLRARVTVSGTANASEVCDTVQRIGLVLRRISLYHRCYIWLSSRC